MQRDKNNEWDNSNAADEVDSNTGRWAKHSTPRNIIPDEFFPPLPRYTNPDC